MQCDRIPPSRLMYETAAVLSMRTSTCLPNSSGRKCRKAKSQVESSEEKHLQRVGCPDTEDNDRFRHPQTGNDRNQKDTDETAS